MYNYSQERHRYSIKMSGLAMQLVYRPIFGATKLIRMDSVIGDPSNPDLRGTDIVLVLKSGRRITVSERFRDPRYYRYNDITVRNTSLVTGRKLEVVGLNSQYYMYGISNNNQDGFIRWDIMYSAKLMEHIEKNTGKFKIKKNTDNSSSFILIPRKGLFANKIIIHTFDYQFSPKPSVVGV